jgi:hypothetical protein
MLSLVVLGVLIRIVVMPNVFKMSIAMLNLIMFSFLMLSVIILSIVMCLKYSLAFSQFQIS